MEQHSARKDMAWMLWDGWRRKDVKRSLIYLQPLIHRWRIMSRRDACADARAGALLTCTHGDRPCRQTIFRPSASAWCARITGTGKTLASWTHTAAPRTDAALRLACSFTACAFLFRLLVPATCSHSDSRITVGQSHAASQTSVPIMPACPSLPAAYDKSISWGRRCALPVSKIGTPRWGALVAAS